MHARTRGRNHEQTVLETAEVLDAVRRAMASEPLIDLRRHPIEVTLAGRTLRLEGEVPNIAAKRRALARAAAVAGVADIVDRLRVPPAQRMTDGDILDRLREALLREAALGEVALLDRAHGQVRSVRKAPQRNHGWICMHVEDGVVFLDGQVPESGAKRLAGLLAWWVPGSRDVHNDLRVAAPETDPDDHIAAAVRTALAKDPFLDARRVHVSARNRTVRLSGAVRTDPERESAELDSWYVFGVQDVENRIDVRPADSED